MAIIGIDCGATKIEFMLSVDHQYHDTYRYRIPTPLTGNYDDFINLLVTNIKEIQKKTGHISERVGIGIPGSIRQSDGLIKQSSIKFAVNHSLQNDLHNILKIPIKVENDTKCFALSEAVLGAGKNHNFVIGVILGSGMAAGFIYNQKLIRGANGMAGEIGHWVADPMGPKCHCSHYGCFETLTSGKSLEKNYFLISGQKAKVSDIFSRYQNQQPAALTAIDNYLQAYGIMMASLINMLDPPVIVLGGGVSNLPILYESGLDYIKKFVFGKSFTTKIVKNKLGDSSGVYGACLL